MPPAVPVNLQMWPSAPQEKKKRRDGGREEKGREERSGRQRRHKAWAQSSRSDLAPCDQTGTYSKSEKLPRNKGPFLPYTHRKKKNRQVFSTVFFLEQAVFHLWGYYLLHCRAAQ